MVVQKEVRGFALTKKFLHEQVFPNFPEMLAKISKETERNYMKMIYKPINTERQSRIAVLNKQSVYRNIELKEKPISLAPSFDFQSLFENQTEAKNKLLSEKITCQNLTQNITSLESHIDQIHN